MVVKWYATGFGLRLPTAAETDVGRFVTNQLFLVPITSKGIIFGCSSSAEGFVCLILIVLIREKRLKNW